jgi:hypothetical protein
LTAAGDFEAERLFDLETELVKAVDTGLSALPRSSGLQPGKCHVDRQRIAEFHTEMTEWRHRIYAHPEAAFEEHKTGELILNSSKPSGSRSIAALLEPALSTRSKDRRRAASTTLLADMGAPVGDEAASY